MFIILAFIVGWVVGIISEAYLESLYKWDGNVKVRR